MCNEEHLPMQNTVRSSRSAPSSARVLFVALLAGLGFALLGRAAPPPPAAAPAPAGPRQAGGVVYLGGGLSDEGLIALGSAVAASPGSVLLLDSPPLSAYLRDFLADYRPERVVPVGTFAEGKGDLEKRLGVRVDDPIAHDAGPPTALWKRVFPKADRVVVCPAQPRARLLRAAALAGAKRAPLWVSTGSREDAAALRRWLGRRTPLATDAAVDAAYLACLGPAPVETLVAANPADLGPKLGGMSALAPWLAVRKRAALLLTNDAGTNLPALVEAAVRRRRLRQAETLVLAANLLALPMLQRPNPIPGDKDPAIDLEPLTPPARRAAAGRAPAAVLAGQAAVPFSFAVGRLFHENRAVVPLNQARQELMARGGAVRRALVASNPGGSLPLLETFSRNTANELRNAGYDVTALYGKEVAGPLLRRQMAGKDLFLWEGHHNTLINDWAFPSWDEPLPPTFVFLQSCLALKDYKVQPLLGRGAVGVVGSSTRTYSGSGGAFSLAFFDALVYEGRSLGGALRQAKNFMVAYALLKEKRLGPQAARTGANLRAAWAFTLWGDPTFRLPRPALPPSALPAVRHEVVGNTIVLQLPAGRHDKVRTAKYQVRMRPNARLAGLVRKKGDADGLPLVSLVFAEVHLPRARPGSRPVLAGQVPHLRTRLPSSRWVFVWDARRRTGYLLATPRPGDKGPLRFQVDWSGQSVASSEG